MAKVNLVEKTARFTTFEIVKYQIMTHCYIHDIHMTDAEIDCLTLLALQKEIELSEFCFLAVREKIFKTTQTVRNCVGKFDNLGLITKSKNKGHKKIKINNDLKIQASGNIMLNYKFIFIDSEKSK